MFNTKLSIVRKMKRLRTCVLVSVCPSGNVTLFSASFPTTALNVSGRTFQTQCISRVSTSGPRINLLPGLQVIRTFPLSTFQRVLPVTRSISPRMILESCALNAGVPIGFSAVIVWAGVVVPLPLLPPLPLPCPGHLGNVAARMLRPPEGMLRYTDVGSTVGQFFGGSDK